MKIEEVIENYVQEIIRRRQELGITQGIKASISKAIIQREIQTLEEKRKNCRDIIN